MSRGRPTVVRILVLAGPVRGVDLDSGSRTVRHVPDGPRVAGGARFAEALRQAVAFLLPVPFLAVGSVLLILRRRSRLEPTTDPAPSETPG